MRSYSIMLLLIIATTALGQEISEVPDSAVNVTDLQEYVVESKNAWFEKDKAVFVPTRQEKNRANSVGTLVLSMNIPLIKFTEEGGLKNLKNEEVSVFINGHEANDNELATFWPQDVIRIEYLANPSDPKFKGMPAVINIVAKQYIAGGLTKAATAQRLPVYYGAYQVASKLVYKRMTYGCNLSGDLNNEKVPANISTDYRDIWYNYIKFNSILNSKEESSRLRSSDFNAAVNAVYDSGKVRIEHTAGLSWESIPFYHKDGIDQWTPDLFGSDKSWSNSSSHSISPWISGQYIIKLNPKWTFSAFLRYIFLAGDKDESNQTGNTAIIQNFNSEKSHNLVANALWAYNCRKNLIFQLQLRNNVYFYNVNYSGTYNQNTRQIYGTNQVRFYSQWHPHANVELTLMPYLTITHRRIQNDKKMCNLNPNLYASINWYQSQKAYLNGWASVMTNAATAAQTTQVIQKESELIWFAGNSGLNNYTIFQTGVLQTWMCTSWFTPSLRLDYTHSNHNIFRQYSAAPEDMGGVIHQYVDTGRQHNFSVNANLNVNLFNRQLNIDLNPGWYIVYSQGDDKSFTYNRFVLSGHVQYNIGNFNIQALYNGATKNYYNHGQYYDYWPDNFGAAVGYGNGNIYVQLMAHNIFHKYNDQRVHFMFDHYVSDVHYQRLGRHFSLTLSYTIGYGKKVNHNIDIDSSPDMPSGAIAK